MSVMIKWIHYEKRKDCWDTFERKKNKGLLCPSVPFLFKNSFNRHYESGGDQEFFSAGLIIVIFFSWSERASFHSSVGWKPTNEKEAVAQPREDNELTAGTHFPFFSLGLIAAHKKRESWAANQEFKRKWRCEQERLARH